jgi:pyruvate formate-lyase/glycerol dehydratase family glycyl radical enzyme
MATIREERTADTAHSARTIRTGKVPPRIQRLKERFYQDTFYVDSKRALLVTESYRETEGHPIEIRRAKALEKILENLDVRILPDELVVGCQNGRSPRSANVFPEMATYWIERELDEFETRPQDKFIVTDEVKEDLRSIFPYWRGKTLHDHMLTHMPADTRELLHVDHPSVFGWCAYQNGIGHIVLDHENVMKRGYEKIREEAERAIERLDLTDADDLEKLPFLQAVVIVSNAAVTFGKRYAEEARRLAAEEVDEVRRGELLRIAGICDRVPAHPAETFHEAVQFLWFTELITQIETNGVSISPGRFDQYMYPYYKKDIERGVLTEEEALDIIECLWIKLSEMVILYDKITASFIANFSMGEHLNLGGQNADGSDAANALSYLCLQAQMDVGLMQPNLSVRYHEKGDPRFMIEALRVVREKNAIPQFLNDELFVPAMVERGVPLEEARCYAADGCDEMCVPGKMGGQMFLYLSLAKILELALNDGRCLICGRQMGPRTGDPRRFTDLDDVWEAYEKQLVYAYRHAAVTMNTEALVHRKVMPVPFLSSTLKGSIGRGRDMTAGGADYYWTSLIAIAGMSNVGDSLVALKKLVFEDKVVEMDRLMEALKDNFEGHESLRQMLINRAPKFGNDIDDVDALTVRAVNRSYEESQKYRDARGGTLTSSIWPAYLTVTAHVQFGESVGAMPDGRLARSPLNDGISPTQGRDMNGPTAAMNSVAKLDHSQSVGGMIYNMKFSPDALKGDENLARLVDLIAAYFEKGGGQVQFNVTSAETLREAQVKPEKHKNLMVRVVGYAALFVELNTAVQDDLIKRTQYTGCDG